MSIVMPHGARLWSLNATK